MRHSVSSAKLESKFLWSSARYIWASSAYRSWATCEIGNDITERGSIEGKKEGAHHMGVRKHLKSYYLV